MFPLKVGLAVLLVSLLILLRGPYEVFGTNIIWSILTVILIFEYTVGATLNREVNRTLGSLLAGMLAICVAQVALHTGRVTEPFILGVSIFFIGTIMSFIKMLPSMVPYEYGFRVTLFTYCMIIVSGYREENPIRTAIYRLYSIAIGGVVAVLVNVIIAPIWAGEQLHTELVKNFNSVADSLEESVGKYLKDDGSEHLEFAKIVADEFPDEPAYKRCLEMLNSSEKLDILAVSAKWEPPHGRFGHFFYPWSEYVKVGAVLRYCAYEVMALHGVLHSEIQAPFNLRTAFQSEIQDVSRHAAELVRCLGRDISDMNQSLKSSLIRRVHVSAERLQRAVDTHSYLLTATSDPNTLSKPLQKLRSDPEAFSKLSQDSQLDGSGIERAQNATETYHELMRKQSRRLHSWPSREADAFQDEECGANTCTDLFLPRMRVLESRAAFSLANFTSLLIEFVARLDHLAEAVDQLAKLAKFKREGE